MVADGIEQGRTAARTRRRTNATLMLVQVTLFVACLYRLHPFLGWMFVPSLMRLFMSCAVIGCCWLNERDRRRSTVSMLVFPPKS